MVCTSSRLNLLVDDAADRSGDSHSWFRGIARAFPLWRPGRQDLTFCSYSQISSSLIFWSRIPPTSPRSSSSTSALLEHASTYIMVSIPSQPQSDPVVRLRRPPNRLPQNHPRTHPLPVLFLSLLHLAHFKTLGRAPKTPSQPVGPLPIRRDVRFVCSIGNAHRRAGCCADSLLDESVAVLGSEGEG